MNKYFKQNIASLTIIVLIVITSAIIVTETENNTENSVSSVNYGSIPNFSDGDLILLDCTSPHCQVPDGNGTGGNS